MARSCESAGALLGLDAIIRQQGAIDIIAQRLGLGRNQVAPNPFPDRLKRHPRQPSGALVIGSIVDKKRLDRRKEQASGIVHARLRLAFGADGAPQLLQDELVAGRFLAARDAAFKLGDEHGARLGLQGPQIIAQPFDGLSAAHAGHHRRLESNTIPLGGGRLRRGYAGRRQLRRQGSSRPWRRFFGVSRSQFSLQGR